MFQERREGKFELVSQFQPQGDQPEAIEKLAKELQEGKRFQVLLGVTGSGKTFTMANVIARVNKPTLRIAPPGAIKAAALYRARRRTHIGSVPVRCREPLSKSNLARV